jgi:hypothetical protein
MKISFGICYIVLLGGLLFVAAPDPIYSQEKSAETLQTPDKVFPSEELILPEDKDRISIKELQQRLAICLLYVTDQTDPAKIIEFYKLDTERKRRDWELQCQLTAMGVDLGYQEGIAESNETENGRHLL